MKISCSKSWKIIYIYTIPGIMSYNGFVKIGETSIPAESLEKISNNTIYDAAKKRIKEQTSTVGLNAKIEYATLAIKKENGIEKIFSDKDFHSVLAENNCPISLPKHKSENYAEDKIISSTGSEWFKIEPEKAIEWIEEYKSGKKNFSIKRDVISLRKPQLDASEKIQKAYEKIKNTESSTSASECFLLDAIMRFGKCITAYDFINKSNIKKTLILTHRPVVKQSWYEDFTNFFKNKQDEKTYNKNYFFYTKDNPDFKEKNIIYFASIQDMRSVQYETNQDGNPIYDDEGFKKIKLDENDLPNFKKSNKEIFNTEWDLVIVDEAHEGNKTTLAEEMHKFLKRKFTLYLSGTTFNIRYDSNFEKKFGKNIFVFDQESETRCNEEWVTRHGTDHNPYSNLPKIHLNGVSISKENLFKAETQTGYKNNYFDFRLFFELDENEEFVNKEKINEWLNNMTSDDTEDYFLNKLPYNKLNRFSTQHSLWVLPKDGTKIAKKLEMMLKKHDFFKKRGYEIFNVSGDSWNGEKTFDKIIECTNDEKKCSITLSVDRLTTGVTVKGWSAILLLNNAKSPMKYFQTIYRAKSPSPDHWQQRKENSLIFDFNPDRMLSMVFEVARKKSKKEEPTENEIRKVLNFFNVMSFIDNDFVEIDAAKLKSSIDKSIIYEIVENGFKSNLFLDVKNIEKQFSINKEKLSIFLDSLEEKISRSEKSLTSKKITDHGLDIKIISADENDEGAKGKKETDEEASRIKEFEKIKTKIRKLLNNMLTKVPYMLIGKTDEIIGKFPENLENFSVEDFCALYSPEEWSEVMQKIEKKEFKEGCEKFIKKEIFNKACQEFISSKIMPIEKIVNPLERKFKWIEVFETLQNPDSETVLTPWEVVEKQYNLSNINWKESYIKKSKFLEINSKSSLYPLYAACKLYEAARESNKIDNWNKIIYNQIFIICKTNLSKQIAQKVVGFENESKNIIVVDIPSKIENN